MRQTQDWQHKWYEIKREKIMYILFGLMGALFGAHTAKKRNGKRADIAQYAAGYGICFALIGLIFTILLDLSMV